jgi:4-hydroxybenzoate polyprenyltransferase
LEEDKLNKPWRPLPAGRITLQNSLILRWLSIIASLLLSAWYSGYVLAASFTYTVAVTLYHELNGHGHWLMKSLMNAGGLTTIALGSTLIAGMSRPR